MAESGLIISYLAALSAQLPAPVVAELADGLDQTRQHYLDQGLSPGAAAEAAVTEFGPAAPHRGRFYRPEPGPARRRAGCWPPGLRSAPAGPQP